MFHRLGASLCLLLLAVTPCRAMGRDPAVRSAAAAISPEAFLVVELPEPRAVLDRLFEPQMRELLTSQVDFLRREDEQGFRDVENLIAHFEQRFATHLQGVLTGLVGGGVTLALGPGEQALLIVEAEDAAMLSEVHDFALLIARSEAEQAGEPHGVRSADYRGVRGWSLGPHQVHALLDNRLLVANDASAIRGALDRLLDPQQPNLAGVDAYRQARRQIPDSAVARGFARADVLRELPGEGALQAVQQNPLAMLLLQLSQAVAAFLDDLASTTWTDRVLLVTFSEFGRTLSENGRRGTDHGAAAPLRESGTVDRDPQAARGEVARARSAAGLADS